MYEKPTNNDTKGKPSQVAKATSQLSVPELPLGNMISKFEMHSEHKVNVSALSVGSSSTTVPKLVRISATETRPANNHNEDKHAVINRTSSRSVKLSQMSTRIFEVSGIRSGEVFDADQDCHCAACMKWTTVDVKMKNCNDAVKVEESSEVQEMRRIYSTLHRLRPTCRLINKTKSTVHLGLKGLHQTSKHISVKRYLTSCI